MWTWQRMLKISWTEKVTNEEVLVCANEASSILKTIWHRKHRSISVGLSMSSAMTTYFTTILKGNVGQGYSL